MIPFATPAQWILGFVLIMSSLGVILAPKPVQASISFLLTLMTLATLYLQLSASFIAVMQILVYAGAILVIFMFVIILFQDAHAQVAKIKAKSKPILLGAAGILFFATLLLLGSQIMTLPSAQVNIVEGFGSTEWIGKALYIDFFFPFEAVIFLFLIAVVGALYLGKREVQ